LHAGIDLTLAVAFPPFCMFAVAIAFTGSIPLTYSRAFTFSVPLAYNRAFAVSVAFNRTRNIPLPRAVSFTVAVLSKGVQGACHQQAGGGQKGFRRRFHRVILLG
jgi:hypothetical protein